MPRARSDIANTALRIFLQELGEAYDKKRGFEPYAGKKHFADIKKYFGGRCCYCGSELQAGREAQDHLIPTNREYLGLHAWGNIVPACDSCNAKKQGREWHAFLAERAGIDSPERHKRISSFIEYHKYAPDLSDLRSVAADLYAEVGGIAMTLISSKIDRLKAEL